MIDWNYYESVHAGRRNLLLHLVAVPLFDAAFLYLLLSLAAQQWLAAGISAAFALIAMVVQKNGHGGEQVPSRPFAGPGDFLKRWFGEQFLVFPLFVVSGRWARQYRAAGEI